MAPAACILAATSAAAAASSKRPAASEAEQLADSSAPSQPVDDDALRGKSQQHPKQQQLPCPRCRSTNTKFCYYNNYSTAQPRHFCRACRRYWTHGGTLRDVPVGGATRRGGKRRRVSAEPPNSSATTTTTARSEDDLSDAAAAAFPFLSDGSYYLPPQIDSGGLFAPAASSSWPSSVVPDLFYGLAPWDDGTVGAGAPTGAWSDIAGLDLTWPPPGN